MFEDNGSHCVRDIYRIDEIEFGEQYCIYASWKLN